MSPNESHGIETYSSTDVFHHTKAQTTDVFYHTKAQTTDVFYHTKAQTTDVFYHTKAQTSDVFHHTKAQTTDVFYHTKAQTTDVFYHTKAQTTDVFYHTKAQTTDVFYHTKAQTTDVFHHTKAQTTDVFYHTKAQTTDVFYHTKAQTTDVFYHTKAQTTDVLYHTKAQTTDVLYHTKAQTTDVFYHSMNVAVYQDLESGSAILVQCIPSTSKFELFGTFYNGSEELMIEPELNEGPDVFPAASLSYVQSRKAKSKKEQVSQDQDVKDKFTISHHVIYKGKTMRPKETDYILKGGVYPIYRAGTNHSARNKRATTAYQVELLMVADYSAYSFWLTKSSTSTAAKVLLRQFYAFILNGIDLRYKSVTGSDFTITVLFAGLYIAETPSDALWTEKRKVASGSVYQVNATAALADFRTWIQSTPNLPGHDHAMLFTAYDMEANDNNAVAGLAYVEAACTTYSQSIVQDNFDGILISIAAHELGHSTNCLTTLSVGYNSTALSPFDQQNPGQIYSADTQCRYTQGNDSYLCRSFYDGNYTNICTAFYCKINGTLYCSLSIAAERTTCGDKKWCVAGECVTATEAPSVNDTCPFGDQPGIVSNGQTCAQLVANSSYNCYNYAGSCCGSCQSVYTGIIGCEYGDKATDCRADNCQMYVDESFPWCCNTCYVPPSTITTDSTPTKTTATHTTITIAPSTTSTTTVQTTTPTAKITSTLSTTLTQSAASITPTSASLLATYTTTAPSLSSTTAATITIARSTTSTTTVRTGRTTTATTASTLARTPTQTAASNITTTSASVKATLTTAAPTSNSTTAAPTPTTTTEVKLTNSSSSATYNSYFIFYFLYYLHAGWSQI
ncbi:hypothetical protein ACJMK2_013428 [Sinanodonta woodiana]|uniref:Peptidase M12B domain-containing protein n=1 Tax=Sinanodonta woodiana TaxID=1069815 RepID=A0ABD3UXH1_SINWO